jgi:hypothetical protein
LTAASWATFAALSEQGHILEAVASDNLIDRLHLGLNAILEEKFLSNQIS